MTRNHTLLIALLFFLLLAITHTLYQPSLAGGLVFDDLPNFKPWRGIGDIDSLHDLGRLAFSSIHPPGRPLSLASFVIDDQSWPVDSRSLKRTNILIHLLNTVLVFALLQLLLRRNNTLQRANWIALAVTAIWALHPMQVSNVAYIIQRMNLLSSLLTLIALLAYCAGRNRLEQRPIYALMLCSFSIGVVVPLSILAKENGLLTCAYALLIERFFYTRPGNSLVIFRRTFALPLLWSIWKILALWTPLSLLAIYCLKSVIQPSGFIVRNFTPGERMLTQGPVLADYLEKLLLPRLHSSGLYFDNFPVSHSITTTALLSWGAILILLYLAFRFRNTKPIASFGIFFYFAGHLMESTVLPLELYFEHRNYLPQLGIWLCLVWLASSLTNSPRMKVVIGAAYALMLALSGALTWQNSTLWGDNLKQAAVWYNDNPGSLRASLGYVQVLAAQNRFKDMDDVLEKSIKDNPDSLSPIMAQRYWSCITRHEEIKFDDLIQKARTTDYDVAALAIAINSMNLAKENTKTDCPPSDLREIGSFMTALLSNPRFSLPNTAANLNMNLGELAAARGDLDATIRHYEAAASKDANPVYEYRQAYYLYSAGLYTPALSHLEQSSELATWRYRLLYPDLMENISELRGKIRVTSK